MVKTILLSVLLWSITFGAMFQSVLPSQANILQKGKEASYCSNCGMDLMMFYRTNHAAIVNGKQKEFCSLHCLAETINSGAKVSDIQVVDAKSLHWIDANKAYYVVGSTMKGTMSHTSKYAFKNISDAKEFQEKMGGKIMNFQDALKVAQKDFK